MIITQKHKEIEIFFHGEKAEEGEYIAGSEHHLIYSQEKNLMNYVRCYVKQ